MNLICLCFTVFFAAIALFILLNKVKQKKHILKALEVNVVALETRKAGDESQLKQALGNDLSRKLAGRIAEITQIQFDCYKNLFQLFIDYQPAAIEMLPTLMGKVVTAYIDCIAEVIKLQTAIPISINEDEPEEATEEEIDDQFQYEALIEQLRCEKQDFSDKYNTALKVLDSIYIKYADKLEIKEAASLAGMNLTDIAQVFKVAKHDGG
jgi:hypothetical protein